MTPLIDADILLYEIGFSSQMPGEHRDEEGKPIIIPNSWDFCKDLFDKKIELICDEVGATDSPLLYLTNTAFINNLLNKRGKWLGEPETVYVPVFRHLIAEQKAYKFGRAAVKPFHYHNLILHVITEYNFQVSQMGLEADDLMCMQQTKAIEKVDTIICSRDKDLRQCPGWHYSWECGTQNAIGPILVDNLGTLIMKNEKEREIIKPKPKPKMFGTGAKWLYYQMLSGDAVDNIGGAKSKGPVFAYNLLKDATSEYECYELTKKVFQDSYKEDWETIMREMADLVYMIREATENGFKRWEHPV
jgi:hypothetical protein